MPAYDRSLNVERPWLLDLRTEGFFDRYSKQWHPKHTLTGGVEYYKDQVLDYQDLAAKYSDGTVISKAVYLQDVWQLADSVKAVGSLPSGLEFLCREQAFSCFVVGISAL